MKWIKNIAINNKTWLKKIFGWSENISKEFDETILINDCFSTYLQKIAADQLKPPPDKIAIIKTTKEPARILIINQSDQSITTLSP